MLSGRTILIVEAEFIVALDLQATLEDLGAERVIIAKDAAHASEISTTWATASLAIIEVEREKPDQIALAGTIARLGIPLIGLSTDHDLPKTLGWLAAAPIVLKPMQSDHLIEAIARLIEAPSTQNE